MTAGVARRLRLFRSFGNLDEVIAELGFDRTMNLADFAVENNLIKFPHHLASAKFAQIPTLSTRRTLG